MPHIEENDLLELFKTIDKINEERDEFETVFKDERKKNKKLKTERNVLLRVSTLSLLSLITAAALYFIIPKLFIQQRYLNANGLALVHQDTLNEETTQTKTTNEKSVAKRIGDSNSESTFQENIDVPISEIETSISDEMFYVVQIAASEIELVSIFYRGLKGLKETHEDGYYKYFIGNYDTLDEAQKQRKQLLKIGFKDAFVASYTDNKRLKIEEAW